MRAARRSGYFGIGIYNAKIGTNIGTLWRSANIFGASLIFTIGRRYKTQSSDTMKTPNHIPLFEYENFETFYDNLAWACPLVGVEITERAHAIQRFIHPKKCVYLLGAEDNGIPESIINRCHSVIALPGDYYLNVAVAGSIVMYDREVKKGVQDESSR